MRYLLILSTIFLVLSLILGEVFDFYNRFFWWDIFLHLKSGWMAAVLFSYLILKYTKMVSGGYVFIFSTSVAVHAGVLWELLEYFLDQTFGLNMQASGLKDTMGDLAADLVGATIGGTVGYRLCLGHNSGPTLNLLRKLLHADETCEAKPFR